MYQMYVTVVVVCWCVWTSPRAAGRSFRDYRRRTLAGTLFVHTPAIQSPAAIHTHTHHNPMLYRQQSHLDIDLVLGLDLGLGGPHEIKNSLIIYGTFQDNSTAYTLIT
ncbi:hypothetical protein F4809DRAFT_101001 [Biscogniauxia mediterranea]|nr:hypothetical protein F4809DRAFT_101001 [Biscogniauxia mediterranea]